MPGTAERLEEALARSIPLAGTAGQAYVERRGITVQVAEAAGVRYAGDFAGRAAVVAGLYDHHGMLASVHGRYLEVGRRQDKMLTIGPGGGAVNVLGGWRSDPLILVGGIVRRPVAGGVRLSMRRDHRAMGAMDSGDRHGTHSVAGVRCRKIGRS